MPRGTYLHADPLTGAPAVLEMFDCAVGPVGWRYVATFRPATVAGDEAGAGAGDGTGGATGGGYTDWSGDDARYLPDDPPVDPTTHPANGPVLARADVTLDAAGRQIRVELAAGGWLLRGGVAGPDTAWVRTSLGPATPSARSAPVPRQGEEPVGRVRTAGAKLGGAELGGAERSEPAVGFAAFSPAFLVATGRLVRRTRPAGRRHRLRLVEVDRGALATRTVEQAWTLVGVDQHETDTGVLPVEHWDVDDLTAGTRGEVYLAGDVVLAAPGLELATLDGPPTVTF